MHNLILRLLGMVGGMRLVHLLVKADYMYCISINSTVMVAAQWQQDTGEFSLIPRPSSSYYPQESA